MQNTPLDQKTVVVCGGSSGIGLAAARLCSALGAEVTIASRSRERLEDARQAIGGKIRTAELDCADAPRVADFFNAFESVDHLIVSLAGNASTGPFQEISEEAFRDTFDGKFWPYVNVVREAVPRLSAEASVTLVIGASAISAVPGAAVLSAVNGALEGMMKTLAVELAPRRINAVSPGLTDTEAWQRIPDEIREQMYAQAAAQTPVGRIGQADDVAQAVAACVLNGFLTGLVLPCDGGKRLT